jgi:hypothetical protein
MLIACAGTAWLAFYPDALRAQSPAAARVQLHWRAPAECMSESSAQRGLRARIGAAPATQNSAEATVSIAQDATGYRAQIAFSGGLSGTRELRAARCDSLSDAALLIVAITAAPHTAAAGMSGPRDAQREPTLLHWQLSAALRGDFGSLPQPTIGPSVQLGIALSRLSVDLGFEYWLPRKQSLGVRAGTGVEVGLWNVAVAAGVAVVQVGRVDFGPALSLAAGSAYGKPLNLSDPRPVQRVPWVGGLVGLQVRIAVSSFALRAAAELGLCIAQPEFTLSEPKQVLFRSARVFGRVGLGIGWMFR